MKLLEISHRTKAVIADVIGALSDEELKDMDESEDVVSAKDAADSALNLCNHLVGDEVYLVIPDDLSLQFDYSYVSPLIPSADEELEAKLLRYSYSHNNPFGSLNDDQKLAWLRAAIGFMRDKSSVPESMYPISDFIIGGFGYSSYGHRKPCIHPKMFVMNEVAVQRGYNYSDGEFEKTVRNAERLIDGGIKKIKFSNIGTEEFRNAGYDASSRLALHKLGYCVDMVINHSNYYNDVVMTKDIKRADKALKRRATVKKVTPEQKLSRQRKKASGSKSYFGNKEMTLKIILPMVEIHTILYETMKAKYKGIFKHLRTMCHWGYRSMVESKLHKKSDFILSDHGMFNNSDYFYKDLDQMLEIYLELGVLKRRKSFIQRKVRKYFEYLKSNEEFLDEIRKKSTYVVILIEMSRIVLDEDARKWLGELDLYVKQKVDYNLKHSKEML